MMRIEVINWEKLNEKELKDIFSSNESVVVSFGKYELDTLEHKEGFISLYEIENDPFLILTDISKNFEFKWEKVFIIIVPAMNIEDSKDIVNLAKKNLLSSANAIFCYTAKNDSGVITNTIIL